MPFSLPDLPYAHDALAPHMSRETLEYHHDKHHLAYVNNGNNLLKGTEWENKSLEEVVKGSFGKNAGLFNNAGQHYNHMHFWKWMKPGGGGDKIPGALKAKIDSDLGGVAKAKEDFIQAGVTQFGSGWAWLAVKDGKLVIAKTAERREPAGAGRASRSSAATSGSTPITSTTATAGRTISRRSGKTWSTGTTSTRCSRRPASSSATQHRRNRAGPHGPALHFRPWRIAAMTDAASHRCDNRMDRIPCALSTRPHATRAGPTGSPIGVAGRCCALDRRADLPRLRTRLGRLHPRAIRRPAAVALRARASATRARCRSSISTSTAAASTWRRRCSPRSCRSICSRRGGCSAPRSASPASPSPGGSAAASADRSPGLLALVLLAACPLYYGHMFINPKDAPFAVAMALFLLGLVRAARAISASPRPTTLLHRRPRLRPLDRLAHHGGLRRARCARRAGAAVRDRGARRRRAARRPRGSAGFVLALIPSAILAYAVMALLWPWSVVNPLNPLRAIEIFSHFFEKPWQELFDGALIEPPDMPRSYVPMLLGLKLPELFLACSARRRRSAR